MPSRTNPQDWLQRQDHRNHRLKKLVGLARGVAHTGERRPLKIGVSSFGGKETSLGPFLQSRASSLAFSTTHGPSDRAESSLRPTFQTFYRPADKIDGGFRCLSAIPYSLACALYLL